MGDGAPVKRGLLMLCILSGACRGDIALDEPDAPDAATALPDTAAPGDAGSSAPDDGMSTADTARPDMPPPLVGGLTAEYYAQYRVPVLTRVEPAIDHAWGDAAPDPAVPADFFSARWTGRLVVPASGSYTFWAETDDGLRVWVDGALVIDAWQWQFPTRYEGTAALTAGEVDLRVEYMERDLTAVVRLGWRSDAIAERVLGEEDFRTTGAPSALPAPQSPYQNPVIASDCPDPGVAQDPVDGAFYAICTGGPLWIRRSYDLVFWEGTFAAVLPDGKPAWAANGNRNWAPEIHRVADRWVVYYTSVNGADVLSIGAAYADAPTGPFTDLGAPLVEHPQGVIDAHYFRDDDGRHYLTYKIDGNATGQPTPIYLRELAPDGLSFAPGSTQVELIRNNPGTWEGGVVEAQWLVKRQGSYYLFYSGNVYDNRYRTGVARAAAVGGPYEKRGAPILANNARWVGPGHGSVIALADTDVFVYHAWPALGGGAHDTSQGRHVLVDRIRWESGWPVISDGTPSTTPQPAY